MKPSSHMHRSGSAGRSNPSYLSTPGPPYCRSKFQEHYPLQHYEASAGPPTLKCSGESAQPRQVTVLTGVPPSFGYLGVGFCWKCHNSVILPPIFSLLALECV